MFRLENIVTSILLGSLLVDFPICTSMKQDGILRGPQSKGLKSASSQKSTRNWRPSCPQSGWMDSCWYSQEWPWAAPSSAETPLLQAHLHLDCSPWETLQEKTLLLVSHLQLSPMLLWKQDFLSPAPGEKHSAAPIQECLLVWSLIEVLEPSRSQSNMGKFLVF